MGPNIADDGTTIKVGPGIVVKESGSADIDVFFGTEAFPFPFGKRAPLSEQSRQIA